jgi:methionyl-tRNA formyltransferase
MRVVVLASGAFAEPSIRWLAQSGHDIPLVVTQPARGSGRGRAPTPTPVKLLADSLGLPVAEIENVNLAEFVTRIAGLQARVMLVIAFGQKLGPGFLASSPGGAINLHASLLPGYRGAAPINWAIVRGESQTGCTVFKIVSRMDAGPVLVQDATEILAGETAGELHDRLAVLGVETVRAALAMYERDEDPAGRPQDESQVSIAPKLKKADGNVEWARPAREVVNRIRGMTPWPGATARFVSDSGKSEAVTLVRCRAAGAADARSGLAPGTVTNDLHVAVGDGAIEVMEIQPASGRVMAWADFVNGRRVRAGDRFEAVS